MKFTEEQVRIIEAGPYLAIDACPGSGKSTVLVARIKRQVMNGVRPEDIVCITFTRKAAAELKRKLSVVGVAPRFVGTVHSWALSVINEHRDPLSPLAAAPDGLFKNLVRTRLEESGIKLSFEGAIRGDHPLAEKVLKVVRSRLEEGGLIDFDGILSKHLGMCGNGWKFGGHLFVDEVQDTGLTERCLYTMISTNGFTMVGDVNQTLYEFRGASPETFQQVADVQGMERMSLTQSFRCPPEVMTSASAALNGEIREGQCSISDAVSVILMTQPDVVLCGTNQTREDVSMELASCDIAVATNKKTDREQEIFEAYVMWRADTSNSMAAGYLLGLTSPTLLQAYSLTAARTLREISDLIIEEGLPQWLKLSDKLKQRQEQYPDLPIEDLADQSFEDSVEEEGLPVMTVHAAKGLEWGKVLFLDDCGTTAHHRRMRYVAISRAKQSTTIIRMKQNQWTSSGQ